MSFLKQKKVLIIFILLIVIGGLLFWALADKLSGDCSRNKGSSITIGGDKVYCDHEGRMWSHTLPYVSIWNNALERCENLTYAKKNDWELPDIFTLVNLHYNSYYYVTCNDREFIDFNSKNNWDPNVCTPSSPAGHYYWSSSEFENKAWELPGWFGYDPHFGCRSSPYVLEKSMHLSVRCVEKAKIIEKGSDKTCNKIKNQNERDYCYEEIAASKQDSSICDNIQEQKIRDYCYSEVAASKQDSSICDNIQQQNFKDFCNWRIAVFKQDSSICDNIQNELSKNFKDYCYAEIAALKKDSSICDKIDWQEKVRIPYHTVKDNCYQYIAVSKQNASICDKIQEQNFKDWNCYSYIKLDSLSSEQSLAICDKIQDQSCKDSCYKRTAVANKNLSICDKIQDEDGFTITINGVTKTRKEWCYKEAK